MHHEWSLDKPVKEYYNENEDGTFKIRVCQNCFSTFETAPICPYCGTPYETTPVEIQNLKEIELRKVEEAKEEQRQRYLNTVAEKVKDYKSAKECTNWVELVAWCKHKGYKNRLCLYTSKANGNEVSEERDRQCKKYVNLT